MSLFFNKDTGSVTVNSKDYAVNFIWGVTENKRSLKETLKTESEHLGANLACSFQLDNSELCYGIADESIGHSVGMLVLPAMLARCFDGPVLGAWALDDDYWYIFGTDSSGVIIIDKAVSGEDTAYSFFCSSIGDDKWDNVICPESWDHRSRTGDFPLTDIPKKNKVTLKSIDFKLKKKYILLLAVILVASALFFNMKKISHQETYVIPSGTPVVEVHNVFPGKGHIISHDVIVNCRDLIFKKLIFASSLPGYKLSNVSTCSGTDVTFNLKREFGSSDYIPSWIKNNIEGKSGQITELSDDEILLKYPLVGHEFGDVEAMPDILTQRKELLRQFNNSFQRITISEPYSCGKQPDKNHKYDRYFSCSDFNFSFKYNPSILIPIFASMNDVVINSVKYNSLSSDWNISGMIYGLGSVKY